MSILNVLVLALLCIEPSTSSTGLRRRFTPDGSADDMESGKRMTTRRPVAINSPIESFNYEAAENGIRRRNVPAFEALNKFESEKDITNEELFQKYGWVGLLVIGVAIAIQAFASQMRSE